MSARDDLIDEWERRYKQMNLPDMVRIAVDRLQQYPEEESVELNPPSADFYLARCSDFTERMGIIWRYLLVDGEIYVIFLKYTDHFL